MVHTVSSKHPDSVLESLRDFAFVCPLCHGDLDVVGEAYCCAPCERTYPLQGGIPDFRVFPDPYLDFEAERRRTELILAALDRYPFEPLLEYYWSLSDITPPLLRAKFIRNALLAEQRARRVLDILGDGTFRRRVVARRVLEVGSGTGNFLAAAAPRYDQVIGTDIAMRWLHVSRRRFRDAGQPEPALVCCCAEYLPFPDGVFDLAVSYATLEFTRDPGRALAECARILRGDGALYLNTANRFSIAPDPYAYLWGVGFLPRAWQPGYVRWRRRASYEHIRPLSLGELKWLAARHFAALELALPDIADESLRRLPTFTRWQVRVYRLLKGLPGARQMLRWVGPQWDVLVGQPLLQEPSHG
jgi:SAM-dependent methyltransferase